ncbi:MAG: hypothetical protein A2782_00250 [Candidatus Blackburnbacteria bacterium RIFCSPHIGHO2_01_FULL_43_15b]|uniref:Transcriptional regulator MraZ n=1 Tax=Candidatus Blackburnbacteria bacterium RIFCSPHIGHO2_01_FULL_43_15b TaxID=1797513 RepID=A0A1G1V1P5_9BACT|nr:MAG: hypothetical protein A2782_00250 [Candidatus Blackburnbacteria bacterium RIFCSPHIGHO2_01_FULL_43_15b]
MLLGQYIQKIDQKGRTILPAKIKKEIGQKVILSRWYENSLAIFEGVAWNKIIQEATLGLSVSEAARDTQRFLLGGAYEVELDDKGRFLIPYILREFGKFSVEIIFLGLGNRVEIWDRKLWEEREEKITKEAEKLLERAQGVYNEH